MSLLLLVVWAANPADESFVRNEADLVEVNHCFDPAWNLMFDQVIWWELIDDEYQVIDWRILRNVRDGRTGREQAEFVGGHATPIYCHSRRRWFSNWFDEKGRVQRQVVAIGFRETWTQYDPELEDRNHHPQRRRRGLASAPSL